MTVLGKENGKFSRVHSYVLLCKSRIECDVFLFVVWLFFQRSARGIAHGLAATHWYLHIEHDVVGFQLCFVWSLSFSCGEIGKDVVSVNLNNAVFNLFQVVRFDEVGN